MGFSASAELENEFSDRFWFWTGLSGKRYIHSVYSIDTCPPLPGAIYVMVQRLESGARVPVRMGRFSPLWDFPLPTEMTDGACEIHVHLLAGDESQTARVYDDLAASLELEAADAPSVCRPLPARDTSRFVQAPLPLFSDMAA
ncbi:MAG: hypothetical protein ACR2OL_04755 [Anderseniella sp.]